MAQFNKIAFNEAHKKEASETKTIKETVNYILFKQNNVYYLRRKKDNKQVTLLKDDIEDFVMWGNKEFLKECKNTKFD